MTATSCLPLTKKGELDNQLLAQTIALGLNLRINGDLAGLQLETGKWLTTQKRDYCGENAMEVSMVCTPVYSDVTPYGFICNELKVDPYWYYKLPSEVLCLMKQLGLESTVGGLYQVANKALGQAFMLPVDCDGDGKGVLLSDISGAVDMINNAFDGCRLFLGNLDQKITCPNLCNSGTKSAWITVTDISDMKVYPNPFNDVAVFEFVSGRDAHGVLEIQNLLGQWLETLIDKPISIGVLNRVEYRPGNQIPSVLIYKLKLDDVVFTGKLIYNGIR